MLGKPVPYSASCPAKRGVAKLGTVVYVTAMLHKGLLSVPKGGKLHVPSKVASLPGNPKFLLPWNCCSESCSHDGSLLSSSNVSLSTAMLMLGSSSSSDVGGYGFISANSISPSPRCNSPFSPVKVPKYFLDSPLFCGFLRFPRQVLFPTMLLGMHKRPKCRQADRKTTCFFLRDNMARPTS